MENDLAILEVEDLEQEEDVEVEEKVPKEVMEKVEEAKHIQEHHKEETEEALRMMRAREEEEKERQRREQQARPPSPPPQNRQWPWVGGTIEQYFCCDCFADIVIVEEVLIWTAWSICVWNCDSQLFPFLDKNSPWELED